MNFKNIGLGLAATAAMAAGVALAEKPVEAASLAPGGFTLRAVGSPTVTEAGGAGIGSTDTLDFSLLDFEIGLTTGSLAGGLTEAGSPGVQVAPLTLTSQGVISGTEFFSNATVNSFITGLLLNGEAVVFDLGSSLGETSFTRSSNNYVGIGLDGTLRRVSGGTAVAQATIAALNFSGGLTNIQVETIPTPALLPGLVGIGLAALRKRKNEAEEPAKAEA